MKTSTTISPESLLTEILSYEQLGQIVLDAVGKEVCESAYCINADDLKTLGWNALYYGDINPNGELN